MDPVTRFRVNIPRIIHETIDGEVVMIDFDTGYYYSLDHVGADLWSLIEQGATVSEIVQSINRRYEGSTAVMESAVHRLITQLQQENLIVPDQPEAPGNARTFEVPELDPETGKPGFEAPVLHKYTDMEDLLLLDPIHEVDETGWPSAKPDSSHRDG